jgi:hypothetical protein
LAEALRSADGQASNINGHSGGVNIATETNLFFLVGPNLLSHTPDLAKALQIYMGVTKTGQD